MIKDLIEKNCPYTIELSDSSVAYLRELVDEKKQYNLGFFFLFVKQNRRNLCKLTKNSNEMALK